MSQQINNPLLGLWKLQSFVMEHETGQKEYPLGQKPMGYILYLINNFMMMDMGNSERPITKASYRTDLKVGEELLEIVKSYNSY